MIQKYKHLKQSAETKNEYHITLYMYIPYKTNSYLSHTCMPLTASGFQLPVSYLHAPDSLIPACP